MDNKRYIMSKIYSRKSIESVEKMVNMLGVSAKFDTYTFLNIRLLGTIVLFIGTLVISRIGFLLAPLFAVCYYKGVTYVLLDKAIQNRVLVLESEAISFFEILTLALETGRNLQEAIFVTLDSYEGEIALEFREVLKEVKYGKSLTEALEDMQKRIPSDTVRNVIMSLTQADIYGSSIIDSLYSQIDYLREKRKLEIKAVISKIPIKISIISVFFFIPLILVIILAPVLLGYLK